MVARLQVLRQIGLSMRNGSNVTLIFIIFPIGGRRRGEGGGPPRFRAMSVPQAWACFGPQLHHDVSLLNMRLLKEQEMQVVHMLGPARSVSEVNTGGPR